MALKADGGHAHGTPRHQGTHAQNGKDRERHRQRRAYAGEHHGKANRSFEPVAIGVTPSGQCQKHLRQGKQRQQQAYGQRTVPRAQRHQRRRHAHARHAGVQANVPGNQPGQCD